MGFTARADTVHRTTRPVREVTGIPTTLIKHFSRRRLAVEARYHQLLRAHRADHGEPAQGTRQRLAQRATLETLQLKTAPTRLVDQLDRWRTEAEAVLGAGAVNRLLFDVTTDPAPVPVPHGGVDVALLADLVVATLEQERSTWSRWNLLAEVTAPRSTP